MKTFMITSLFWVAVCLLIVYKYNEHVVILNNNMETAKAEKNVVEEENTKQKESIESLNKKLSESIKQIEASKQEVKKEVIPIKIEKKEYKNIVNTKELEYKLKNLETQRNKLKSESNDTVSSQNYYQDLKREAQKIDRELQLNVSMLSSKEKQISTISSGMLKVAKKDAFGKTDSNPFSKKGDSTEEANNNARKEMNNQKQETINKVKSEILVLNIKQTELESKKKSLHYMFINRYRTEMKELNNNIDEIKKEIENANK